MSISGRKIMEFLFPRRLIDKVHPVTIQAVPQAIVLQVPLKKRPTAKREKLRIKKEKPSALRKKKRISGRR